MGVSEVLLCPYRCLEYKMERLEKLKAETSWAKDVWANYFLGDRRLGDKLGRYGDSKSEGWATCFRRLGEMYEKGET